MYVRHNTSFYRCYSSYLLSNYVKITAKLTEMCVCFCFHLALIGIHSMCCQCMVFYVSIQAIALAARCEATRAHSI